VTLLFIVGRAPSLCVRYRVYAHADVETGGDFTAARRYYCECIARCVPFLLLVYDLTLDYLVFGSQLSELGLTGLYRC